MLYRLANSSLILSSVLVAGALIAAGAAATTAATAAATAQPFSAEEASASPAERAEQARAASPLDMVGSSMDAFTRLAGSPLWIESSASALVLRYDTARKKTAVVVEGTVVCVTPGFDSFDEPLSSPISGLYLGQRVEDAGAALRALGPGSLDTLGAQRVQLRYPGGTKVSIANGRIVSVIPPE